MINSCCVDLEYDGIFLSNGPGNPTMCQKTINAIGHLLNTSGDCKPMFGICLGHQLMSLAIGAKTFKMK